MASPDRIPAAKDKLLFTPGPLTTSLPVKLAMSRDLGSRDTEFIATVARIRDGLLRLAGVSRESGWECVIVQGSGTFGVESVIGSSVPRDGKLLVLANGAYGERIAKMAAMLGIAHTVVRTPENAPTDLDAVARALEGDPAVTHVAAVHCETTTGVLNPVEALGRLTREHRASFFVDAMSSFGAVPVDLEGCHIDFLVSSANKCIEGVPGFSFALCRRSALESCEGRARSLSLDLHAQWRGLESNGQFRFTPPTHALLAFERALEETFAEGGVEGRAARYRENHATVVEGMRALGFEEYLRPEHQSWIITSFRYPAHPAFDFEELYRRLNDRGIVIYPGKVSDADCFRIGNIGRLFREDMESLVSAMAHALREMGVELRR